ncbi:protein of unknown function DUF362 [Desulfofarcimen acetoxidans DSM 771]|uniref:DUF362 domain-containing protein n=2 Tax=Desulfofarcimen acetoxidans TaxID=58138 RepID=C8VW98_DESAS|nr:protein of unknown function DUF362 [Desulfofarcimen acetoxidans DSM 771]
MLQPHVLRKIEVSGTSMPRKRAGEDKENLQVFRIQVFEDVGDVYKKLDLVWENATAGQITPDHRVLIKINLNTGDPYPASTCPVMLSALIDFLRSKGIHDIWVGDCSSISALPTRKVAEQTKVLAALRGKARIVCFDEEAWVRVPIQGIYLKHVTLPQIALDADRIISLANLKTHRHSDYSFGLKLSVGFMHPLERYPLHHDHLSEKIAEISLALQPDLTIIDGRTAFITGGPEQGRTEKAGIVIVGGNPLAVDFEAYRTMYSLKRKYACLEGFVEDPFETAQLGHGRDIGLVGLSWQNYECVEL